MAFIPLSKNKFAQVDDADFDWLNQWKWCVSTLGYAVRNQHLGMVDGKQKKIIIWMHRLIADPAEGLFVDHINMDKLDNRRANLRACTYSQNHMNRKSYSGTSSKYKGVSWNKARRKWHSYIRVEGRQISLGFYINENEAALAYNKAAAIYFAGFARLNEAA